MAMTKKQLLTAAMTLKPKQREQLAEELWQSIDGATQQQVDKAWATEIRRRVAEVDSGKLKLIPADQVMRKAPRATESNAPSASPMKAGLIDEGSLSPRSPD